MKIAIGQYVPGNSALHKADPRTKFILTLVYMVAVLMSKSYVSYIASAALLAAAFICAHINICKILRSLRPLIIMMAMTVVLNIFFYGGTTVLVSFWKITVYKESVYFALKMLLRVILLVLASSVLTYTTTSVMMTDGLESLMSPLKKIHFPAHEIAMIMSIALRFIPTFSEETERIIKAQTARGADFDSKNIIKKIKSYIPIIVPMFVGAWRKADELAMAMNARCYRGGEGRTKYRMLRFTYIDAVLSVITCALLAAVVIANKFV